ncbi:hypothetical protein ABEW81_11165 [Priestia megaterium]
MRRQVKWFADQMEEKLRENDHKGGWEDCDYGYLIPRLGEEVNELVQAIVSGQTVSIVKEAADVANFAMMIADKAKRGPNNGDV